MFNLFKKTVLLEEDDRQWLFDAYRWAMTHFDADVFLNQTILVTPSNKHFPGEANQADQMAGLILTQVKQHAGLSHWPTRLVDESNAAGLIAPKIDAAMNTRGSNSQPIATSEESQSLVVYYIPELLRDPEVMISSYIHTLAYYLGLMTKDTPPGGAENLPHASELLAVFMGFGVVMSNSANTRKIRSCASCSGPAVERPNFLSQYETVYALAIFCRLKDIPTKDVTPQLKSSLRSFFKNAMKELDDHVDQLADLKKLTSLPRNVQIEMK